MYLFTALCLCLLVLIYTYIGYPALAILLGKLRPAPVEPAGSGPAPKVSVVIAMRNEAERAPQRVRNIFSTGYPHELLEVVVVSDGSTDATVSALHDGAFGSGLKIVEFKEHRGKPACLNAAVKVADGEIILFADARQDFLPDTIPNLIRNFRDSLVGAASGELEIARSESGAGSGVDFYWKLEKMTRLAESRSGSSIGCTGAIYAVRRELYQDLPEDTLLDDVVVPMRVTMQGRRVIFDPTAIALDPQQLKIGKEIRRKERTLAGNFQMLSRYPEWLNPWKSPSWWRLFSHKYLRLAAPIFLTAALALSTILAFGPVDCVIGKILFWAQIGLYTLAMIGLALPRVKWKIITIPSAFLFLNIMVVRGFMYLIRMKRSGQTGW